MASNVTSLKAGDAIKGVTVHVRVTGMRRWLIRLWLGKQIIRLGVWVTGASFEWLGAKEES